MGKILTIIQMILGVALVIVVLLQQKGSGLGAAFGGTGGVQSSRRGADKLLYNVTIVVSILFFIVAIINLFV